MRGRRRYAHKAPAANKMLEYMIGLPVRLECHAQNYTTQSQAHTATERIANALI